MKRTLLLLIVFSIFAFAASGNDGKRSTSSVSGITIEDIDVSHDGPDFTVTYKIQLGSAVQYCRVELLLSTDGGKRFENMASLLPLSDDFGKISTSGDKKITFNVNQIKEQIIDRPIVFKIDVVSKDVLKQDYIIQYSMGIVPHLSYGLSFGMVKKFGWYIRALSDFSFPSASYSCASDGFWASGNVKHSRVSATGGALFRATRWCYPYIGAGYGHWLTYWEDVNGQWAAIADKSTMGVAMDAGVTFKVWKIALSVGVNTTMFKYTEAQVGLGVMF